MAKKGICDSPIQYYKWAKPAKARTNSGDVKKGTISNSPVEGFKWTRRGRNNS